MKLYYDEPIIYVSYFEGQFILENKSQTTIPALTEMFNECLVPNCGISIHPSHNATAS